MNRGLSVAIPCRADEPGLGDTLVSLYEACRHSAPPLPPIVELLICINGVAAHTECTALHAARAFCAHHHIPLQERWLARRAEEYEASEAERVDEHRPSITFPIPQCTVLLTERPGKPPAWNDLWTRAVGETVLFCDADVRIEREAVRLLQERLQQEPWLVLVAAREVPLLDGQGTLWSRMAALPYRFDFGNAGGRLLVLRKEALPGTMPEDLLLEDAWLTVAVGKARVAKEWRAEVSFLPPATGHDYFAERVRTEGGKLQIRQRYGQLLTHGPIASYRWRDFFRRISWHEYPLVLLALVLRFAARWRARLALRRKDFYALYRPFRTTKQWKPTARD